MNFFVLTSAFKMSSASVDGIRELKEMAADHEFSRLLVTVGTCEFLSANGC